MATPHETMNAIQAHAEALEPGVVQRAQALLMVAVVDCVKAGFDPGYIVERVEQGYRVAGILPPTIEQIGAAIGREARGRSG